MQELKNRAIQLLKDGTVARVLGWRIGENTYDPEPAFFDSVEAMEGFVYNNFCAANLSKYMIEAGKLEGKTLVCLKPCDTYSYNQLLSEHRVDREKAYIIGVGCQGKLSIEKVKKTGVKGILSATDTDPLQIETLYGNCEVAYKDAMLDRCHVCKGKTHMVYDELIGESKDTADADRFEQVRAIEAMSPEEKFAFFQAELSKCIRCNACRNVCPACSCTSACSTVISSTAPRRPMWIASKRRCSTSSAPSMWQAAAPIAVNAAVFAPRAFPCTCSTGSLSRISTPSTVTIRPVPIPMQEAR